MIEFLVGDLSWEFGQAVGEVGFQGPGRRGRCVHFVDEGWFGQGSHLADHVEGAERLSVPDGQEDVGIASHLDVADRPGGGAMKFPAGRKGLGWNVVGLGPLEAESVDAGGKAGNDFGDGETAGIDKLVDFGQGLVDEIKWGFDEGTGSGDDEFHGSGYLLGVIGLAIAWLLAVWQLSACAILAVPLEFLPRFRILPGVRVLRGLGASG